MTLLWNWVVANHVVIWLGVILTLKWIYNAWTPAVTFPQFIRAFIGEIVQEAPTLHLSAEQQKILAEAGKPIA